ncbi:Acyl-CoA thioesterase FadM [Fibrobacter sp. UWH9]|uniref:acyl-[acyl-carrier-protein] thioesterase n=1 Tax=unclassified Fibrobacter TaxID=2634177 RepID=UPI00091F6CF5|nr:MULTISPECIES: acyl-ACP thioesterase domain-containing protein [unclassified Fibrobacter]MDO4947792.1 thioesterase [Fibrobacter sp.]OWV14849.1 acyl-ACP thioesterase [Fibrobacter sp. UWH1]SHH57215.1 Acyl-CoA thioesterase FadM [Fibrobacter sp. UWH9]
MIDIYSLAKNPLVFQKPRTVTSAYIDVSGKMGVAQTVLMVQDNLCENLGKLKQDNFFVKEKGGYWVISKAKLKFFQRPFWGDKVVTTSYPTSNSLIRTYESTAITTTEGEPIVLAVQEACCLDLVRHRPMKLSTVGFPTEGFPEQVLDDKFTKFEVTPDEYEEIYQQRVLPQHLDMSHHMNNIKYIELSMNVFSSADWELCAPSEMEVHFLGESMEGTLLKIFRADHKGATYMKIEDETGRQVFEMKIKMK